MKFDTKSPCLSCPYRKDSPLLMWDRAEFENLLAQDADPMGGAMFGCHKYRNRPREEQHFCAGWLLDQLKRGVPSIQLRLFCMANRITPETIDSINDGGHKLYPSLKAMCKANMPTKIRRKR